jgi:hypothetical protein
MMLNRLKSSSTIQGEPVGHPFHGSKTSLLTLRSLTSYLRLFEANGLLKLILQFFNENNIDGFLVYGKTELYSAHFRITFKAKSMPNYLADEALTRNYAS